jgi:hypothetical protein
MLTTFPRRSRGTRPPSARVVILVIVLAFVIAMAVLGYAPAAVIGVAATAAAIAGAPETARAVPGD